jgi:formylglycine-generating enzyme
MTPRQTTMHCTGNGAARTCLVLFSALGAGGSLVGVVSCASAASRPEPPPAPAESGTAAIPAAPRAANPADLGAAAASASVPPPSAPPATPAPCPADMIDVTVACIDRFEAPNEEGAKPLLMRNVADAEQWCQARGKRLCTEDEWVRACKGPEGLAYPYGQKYEEHACNQDGRYVAPNWGALAKWPSDAAQAETRRLDQSEPAGQRSTCSSAEGVFDLTGNAGEWVVHTRADPEACQTPEQKAHPYVVKGCFWGKCFRAPHEPSCEYVNCAHDQGFRSYEFGARCCQDRVDSPAAVGR